MGHGEPGAAGPLRVAVLFDAGFDEEAFGRAVAGAARPVEVVTAGYLEDHGWRALTGVQRRDPAVRARIPPPSPAVVEALATAEVVLTLDPPIGLVSLAPNLRWVQAVGAGTNQFDTDELVAAGVTLTSAAGVGAPPIAEFVLARLLQVWKDLRGIEDRQRRRDWAMHQGRLVLGRTVGIVGFGAIGREVATRLRAFGCTVLATRRSWRPGMSDPDCDELFGPGRDHLHAVLARCDAVVLCAPATDETEDLIGRAELRAMRPGSILVNVARGALVDEAALVESLLEGHLGAAVLDVTRREPLPADDPLWDAPNLYLSPHSATSGEGYAARLAALFADNLLRYAAGGPLRNVVVAP